jgi:hypothetical protein
VRKAPEQGQEQEQRQDQEREQELLQQLPSRRQLASVPPPVAAPTHQLASGAAVFRKTEVPTALQDAEHQKARRVLQQHPALLPPPPPLPRSWPLANMDMRPCSQGAVQMRCSVQAQRHGRPVLPASLPTSAAGQDAGGFLTTTKGERGALFLGRWVGGLGRKALDLMQGG